MAYDEQLAKRVRTLIHETASFTERRMFGGAFMYRDRMCVGIVGTDLVVRVAAGEFERVIWVLRRRGHEAFVMVSDKAGASTS